MDALFANLSLSYLLMISVLVGVFVLCGLNLTLGFSLSGLVVPGFLVPLMISNPLTGFIVVMEGVLAYGLVALTCGKLESMPQASRFFGRDRFFAILLASIFSRIIVEDMIPGLVFLWFEQPYLASQWQHSLSSLGLVLVPLLANQFWKSGLGQGLVALGIASTITAIFVFGFMWAASVSNEHISISLQNAANMIPDHGQAYIILLTTVFLASRANLLFGWDVAGILFPGLVALSIFDPAKIALMMTEIVVIVLAAKLLITYARIPAKWTEGAYGVMLCFALVFLYKTFSGTLLSKFGEGLPDDYYGLGFVISSLICLKILKKASFGMQLISSTAIIASLGLLIGTLISISLNHLGTMTQWNTIMAQTQSDKAITKQNRELSEPVAIKNSWPQELLIDLIATASSQNPNNSAVYNASKTQLDVLNQIAQPLAEFRRLVYEEQRLIDLDDQSDDQRLLNQMNEKLGSLHLRLSLFQMDENLQFLVIHNKNTTTPFPENLGVVYFQFRIQKSYAEPTLTLVNQSISNLDTSHFLVWLGQETKSRNIFYQSLLKSPMQRKMDELPHWLTNAFLLAEKAYIPGDSSENLIHIQSTHPLSADTDQIQPALGSQNMDDPTFKLMTKVMPELKQTSLLQTGHVLQKISDLVSFRFHSLIIPPQSLHRIYPLSGLSLYEKHWHISGRSIDRQKVSEHMIIDPKDYPELFDTWQRYLKTANPFEILGREADSALHFQLVRTLDSRTYIEVKDRDMMRIGYFPLADRSIQSHSSNEGIRHLGTINDEY